jgi:hypothetical protein
MPNALPMQAARNDHTRILTVMPPIESRKPHPLHPYQIVARMNPATRNFAPIEQPQESFALD